VLSEQSGSWINNLYRVFCFRRWQKDIKRCCQDALLLGRILGKYVTSIGITRIHTSVVCVMLSYFIYFRKKLRCKKRVFVQGYIS